MSVFRVTALGVWKLEGLPAVQEEPRGILSKLLGVVQPSAGSMVIYLCVCVQCGWGAGSK